jgi:hypothetical protein
MSTYTTRSARHNPFCSSPYPPPQILVPEIYTFSSYERRGQAQTPHMLIATGQEHAKLPRWEAKQLFPLRDKGSIWKKDRHFVQRDSRAVKEQSIANEQTRNQPMHYQLGGVIHDLLVEGGLH